MKFIVAFFFFKGLVQSSKKSQRKKKLLQCYRAKRIKWQLYGKYYKMFASKNDRSNQTARLEFDRPIPFFQQARSLPLTFLYFQHLSLLMCDVYHQAVPSNLRGKFRLMTDVHSYRTRSASNQQLLCWVLSDRKNGKIICENWCSDMEWSTQISQVVRKS